MMTSMTVRKLSISVPPEVEETIKAAAAEEGKPVSAWLALLSGRCLDRLLDLWGYRDRQFPCGHAFHRSVR